MSKTSRSIQIFGIYLIATALVLFVTPNVLLAIIRVPPTTEPWIRVLGVLVGVMGGFYVTAARHELVEFFRMTVWGRGIVLGAFVVLAVLRLAPPVLIGFGLVDALGAVWTWSALRSRAVTA